jgi:hypothetical protein
MVVADVSSGISRVEGKPGQLRLSGSAGFPAPGAALLDLRALALNWPGFTLLVE